MVYSGFRETLNTTFYPYIMFKSDTKNVQSVHIYIFYKETINTVIFIEAVPFNEWILEKKIRVAYDKMWR